MGCDCPRVRLSSTSVYLSHLHQQLPDHDDAPNLAGYKLYWRRTDASQWQESVFVGPDVTQHTLENIIIDNYLFGVASVAENGNESPVVFPGGLLPR